MITCEAITMLILCMLWAVSCSSVCLGVVSTVARFKRFFLFVCLFEISVVWKVQVDAGRDWRAETSCQTAFEKALLPSSSVVCF